MSGFSDTFTKNSEQEDLLNYDDAASYYFMATVLACVVLPWSYLWIRYLVWGEAVNDFKQYDSQKRRIVYVRNGVTEANVERIEKVQQAKVARNKQWNTLSLALLSFAWLAFLYCCYNLTLDTEEGAVAAFDPFTILEVSSSATDSEIKKAYRKMSLIYHPDKNPDDPLASARFIQVTKAYTALTDETAKANYEKYGNPDGPQTTKVGIGLPRFLLEKKNQLVILCVFFSILLILIPGLAISYYQRQKNFAPNGVLIETLQFMGHTVGEGTKVKDCIELLG